MRRLQHDMVYPNTIQVRKERGAEISICQKRYVHVPAKDAASKHKESACDGTDKPPPPDIRPQSRNAGGKEQCRPNIEAAAVQASHRDTKWSGCGQRRGRAARRDVSDEHPKRRRNKSASKTRKACARTPSKGKARRSLRDKNDARWNATRTPARPEGRIKHRRFRKATPQATRAGNEAQ
ncbi:hypothetical protein C8R44DRAFT_906797 [Mycena epipterygia]|nr:hypothetical protein C8R44DRAFT_906797 [Mycena epipterygia]